jgi:hypothetical protein
VVADTPTVTGPTQPSPRLVQLYTDEQRRRYNREVDENLDIVRRALSLVSAKSLSAEDSETVSRIRNFQKQAESMREQDLVAAVTFAKKAELLAQDLLTRLQ